MDIIQLAQASGMLDGWMAGSVGSVGRSTVVFMDR
jgi:hypothetical protein